MTRAFTSLHRYIIAMIKKLNSKEKMNGTLTILTGILVLIGSGMITQAMAQQNQSASDNASSTGNVTGSSANNTGASADSDRKLTEFAKKLGAVIRGSDINLTLPENVSASEAIQKLQSSPGFKALSEKFAQLAQQSGINASDIKLKNLRGEVGSANFTGLVDRLQQLEERIQNRTQQ